MRIAIVVGTRPEVIKMAPVIKGCQERGIDFILIHSNQHYSESMDAVFFQELELPKPDYNLNVGSGGHSNQTGNILIKIEPVLEKEKPDVLLAQGDTNTVLASALAASKLGIPVGHVEAGLRSYDRTMPEETNRVMTDHMSDFLFAVTDLQSQILRQENISEDKIYVVGNTIVDALQQNILLSEKKSTILKKLNLEETPYYLITAHRASNVDSRASLEMLLAIFRRLIDEFDVPLVWPLHLRTRKKLDDFGLSLPEKMVVCEPLGYLDFLQLEKNAQIILTDSGGVQEEACILGVPCITLRENTERPETLSVGASVLCGRDADRVLNVVNAFHDNRQTWVSPFGDGKTADYILDTLERRFGKSKPGIAVYGLGYMGLPTSALFANAGYPVTGIDLKENVVETVNKAECPFEEPGMKDLVHKAVSQNGLSARTTALPADIHIIAVPTNKIDSKCDLGFVKSAAESISRVIKEGDLVVLESTVKPRTCKDMLEPLFRQTGHKVHIVHCPERAIPGNTLHEMVHNDRIIGCDDPVGQKIAFDLYRSFVKGEIFLTDTATAECVKLMENTYRDVNIALANEFDTVCQEFGVNAREAIRLANRHPRVGILAPGPGVGGHCIAIDPLFLCEDSDTACLIPLARKINDQRPDVIVKSIVHYAQQIKASKIGILGAAYKKNVDDARETPSFDICEKLVQQAYKVRVHDPFVKTFKYEREETIDDLERWADLLVLVTDHDQYVSYVFEKPVVDTRGCLS